MINTCTVTNIADRKSRQMLHRARKMNPDAIVVAAGCYVQAQAEHGEIDECIDIVIGNNKKKDLIPLLEQYFQKREKENAVIDINHTKEYEEFIRVKQEDIHVLILKCRMDAINFAHIVSFRMQEAA